MYNLEQIYLTQQEMSISEEKHYEAIAALESRIQDIEIAMIDCADDELEELQMELDELESEILCLA